ncbi:MAG: transglycosylase SLT domain-containing protein, partial [Candidatus Abyssubacteria bacterium]|nr:transglycosylase SLT domain-containing protein [Candidatus Abyssubacteria bacterium]
PQSSAASTAFFERAQYRRSAGMPAEALADYAQVVELFPSSYLAPTALRERAKIYEETGNSQEYAQYERILGEYPRHPLAFSSVMYWGVKLYRSGEYAGARGAFEKLLDAELDPHANADAAFWIAKCNIAEGKTNLARVQLAGIIKRFKASHQEFRARSILKTLAEVGSMYSQEKAADWQKLLAFDRRPFVSFEIGSAENAYAMVDKESAHLERQALDRLGFLMMNHLPEAKWELERVSRKSSGTNARYAIAWALFEAQAYNRAIKVASSVEHRLDEEPRATRVQYLMYPAAYPDMVRAAATRYNIDPMLSLAVMREESHFREDTISPSEARGLMQIIPPTGEWLAGKVFGPARFDRTLLFRPQFNIELGTYYLRYLLDRFDNNIVLAIAAYNWGEGHLERWLGNSPPGDLDAFIESIPAEETRNYVKKVLRSYSVYHSLYPTDYFAEAGS